MPLPEPFMENANVALQDQSLAAAIDALRTAEHWIVVVPAPEMGEGIVGLMAATNGPFALKAYVALQKALLRMAEKYEEDGIEEEAA